MEINAAVLPMGTVINNIVQCPQICVRIAVWFVCASASTMGSGYINFAGNILVKLTGKYAPFYHFNWVQTPQAH